MNISEQIDYYNHKWSEFEFANLLQMERCTAILRALGETGLDRPKICDLGCGAGWLTGVLGTFGPALGVDLSDVGVREAAERYPQAQFAAADILNWDYPKEAFEVVVSQEVIEHVEDQRKFLASAYEMLRPGGFLILTTPNGSTFRAMPAGGKEWSNQPIENWLTQAELRQMMSEKFVDVEVETITFGYGSAGLRRLMHSTKLRQNMRALGIERWWLRTVLRLGYGLHLVGRGRKR